MGVEWLVLPLSKHLWGTYCVPDTVTYGDTDGPVGRCLGFTLGVNILRSRAEGTFQVTPVSDDGGV